MRLSEFRRAVDDEFGRGYGAVVTTDLVLSVLGDRTAEEALKAGRTPKEVWLALCEAAGVPRSHWHGAGRPDPKK
jgi:hypothetical protein